MAFDSICKGVGSQVYGQQGRLITLMVGQLIEIEDTRLKIEKCRSALRAENELKEMLYL